MKQIFSKITLRGKFFLLVGLAVVVPLLIFYVLARLFVNWNLQILEDDLALRDMRAVEHALDKQQEQLSGMAAQYASRGDVYRNVQAQNTSRLAVIFSPSVAERFAVQRLFIFDDKNTLLYEYGNWNEFETTLSARLLLTRILRQSPLTGYVRTGKAVYLFTAHRIATPEDPGSVAGTLIFARQMEQSVARDTTTLTGCDTRFHSVSPDLEPILGSTPTVFLAQGIVRRFRNQAIPYIIERRSEDQSSVFFPLSDYQGDLIGTVEVIFRRESISAALDDVKRILAVLLGGGMLFSLAMATLLARFTVEPALRLRRQVMDIRQSRDLSQRVAIPTHDEIGQVAEAFNHLLDALHTAEQQLMSKNRELLHLSTVDELTQLNNRRFIVHQLEKEMARAQRYENDLSCMILDIDHFKDLNDTQGHAAGDRALSDIAALLRANTRQHDYSGRWGGEEFLIILPESDLEEAFNCAERIRTAIENHDFGSRGKPAKLTASFGIVSLFTSGTKTMHDLLRFADEALYQAKAAGRNRVVIYKSSAYEHSGNKS